LKILRTHKVRIYPDEEQKLDLEKSFNLARFAWNTAWSEWNFEYNEYKNGNQKYPPNAKSLRNKFVKLVKPGRDWISKPSKEAYSNSILDLGKAWDSYFKGIAKGKPKLKSKRSAKKSYKVVSVGKNNLQFIQNRLYIPRFRKNNFIKTAECSRFKGELKNVAISRKGDKYFASCLFQLDKVPQKQYKRSKNKTNIVGIDTGSRTLAHTSDNKEFKLNPVDKINKRINKTQRKLSKQVRGSNNWIKTKIKLENLYLKRSNSRLDDIHKATNYIVRNYNNIALEKLKARNMIRNKKLARTISESYYYEFKRQLDYKINYLRERGATVELFLVDPRNTTKNCSNCGQWNDPGKSKTYHCNHCGVVMDRDFNASLNIRCRAFGI